jgi:8-oxo-dGTP pyrophosphatase MutT (NUDIX family)
MKLCLLENMYLRMTIKRVTTTFLVKGGSSNNQASSCRESLRIAIFHRCATMPTFPNQHAACSGSIETGEVPWETALRELQEETNYSSRSQGEKTSSSSIPPEAGLYVDVDFISPRSGKSSIIRVYPFVIHIADDDFELSLQGTEHDTFQWMSLDEVEELDRQSKTVPSLALAFHHATRGRYYKQITNEERQWASDKENGEFVVVVDSR